MIGEMAELKQRMTQLEREFEVVRTRTKMDMDLLKARLDQRDKVIEKLMK